MLQILLDHVKKFQLLAFRNRAVRLGPYLKWSCIVLYPNQGTSERNGGLLVDFMQFEGTVIINDNNHNKQ